MADVIIDAILDSLKIFAVVALFTFIIAAIEPYLSKKIRLHGKLAPLIGVSISLLPQCGFSVVATDLYKKHHITVGTLIGVFLATSDEALPIFLSYPDKALHILPILALKFAIGLIFGYLIDFICVKNRRSVQHHVEHCNDEYRIRLMHCDSAELVVTNDCKEACACEECVNSECESRHNCECEEHHHHNHKQEKKVGILSEYLTNYTKKEDKKKKIDRFFIHPLLHSLEIFIYVLIVNIIFGIIIYYIGEDKIIEFLSVNKYLAPLFAVIIGAVPNCVSSIVLSELYIMGGLGFGATLGGLCMNAGLGILLLFKDTKHTKRNVIILFTTFFISLFVAYIFSLIFSFGAMNF
ncbi:MAG: arsenic efflux protein [Clostridia bacterium]|nr:arsenic efflux protein [Clostridia bacterium]